MMSSRWYIRPDLHEPRIVIQHEALDHELPQRFGRPDAELSGLEAVDSITDGDDGIQVVEFHLSSNIPTTLCANYFHFGNSCLSGQLS